MIRALRLMSCQSSRVDGALPSCPAASVKDGRQLLGWHPSELRGTCMHRALSSFACAALLVLRGGTGT